MRGLDVTSSAYTDSAVKAQMAAQERKCPESSFFKKPT